ncbi:MAG: pectate lyase [Sediminibacterium sp.]
MIKQVGFSILFSLLSFLCFGQGKSLPIDTSDFLDAAHHWYDIKDKTNTINPRPGHRAYGSTEIVSIADNILLYQKQNGGWPKNYDMQAILAEDQKDSLLKAKSELHTTFDNGSTYAQIAYLASAYTTTKKESYKIAVAKGLDYILAAQYPNGGWPQYFPLENNYSRYITFNDDAYIGIMQVLKDIVDKKTAYDFIEKDQRQRIIASFNKGIDCIIKMQINDAGKPTAWCQQHNEITLEPAWARKFEPPSICNGESSAIVLLLMSINHPSQVIKDAIQHAVAWFNESKIMDTKVQTVDAAEMVTPYTISKHDKVVVNSPGAAPIWTRYYELKTHRPLFCNRDSKVVYSLAEVERERRDGYGWYTYEPQKVLNKYEAWKKKW